MSTVEKLKLPPIQMFNFERAEKFRCFNYHRLGPDQVTCNDNRFTDANTYGYHGLAGENSISCLSGMVTIATQHHSLASSDRAG